LQKKKKNLAAGEDAPRLFKKKTSGDGSKQGHPQQKIKITAREITPPLFSR
ncbi:MAG: hypothetical protein H8E46_12810, partial [FCB group bacterium]|nr:hypothetical protein [FCB group bacterium]